MSPTRLWSSTIDAEFEGKGSAKATNTPGQRSADVIAGLSGNREQHLPRRYRSARTRSSPACRRGSIKVSRRRKYEGSDASGPFLRTWKFLQTTFSREAQ